MDDLYHIYELLEIDYISYHMCHQIQEKYKNLFVIILNY